MNTQVDKWLHEWRTEFEWKYKRYFSSSQRHLDREADPNKVSEIIFNLLSSGKPCMIARYGMTEYNALMNYLYVLKGTHNIWKFFVCKAHAWWISEYRMRYLRDNAGFFPISEELYVDFCKLLLQDTEELDVLASWIDDEIYIEDRLKNVKKIFLPYLEPYWSDNPWSRYLEGKKVLVVHPFDSQIQKQYETKRELLFVDKRVLPEFSLEVIPAVQSLGGENNGFTTWFEALDWMKQEIASKSFDVCIIGCGAYGFHLAAYVKRLGKQAIHMGGATQLLFGIKGNRWENPMYGVKEWGIPTGFYTSLFNEHWIKPGRNGCPQNADNVEGACYW